MPEHEKRMREILSNLGFQEYLQNEFLSATETFLEELAATPPDVTDLRGKRFATCQRQAKTLLGESQCEAVHQFVEFVAKTLWEITFTKDSLASSS